MALDILIVSDASKPYWENEHLLFGKVNSQQWHSLLFNEFGRKPFLEYKAEGNDPNTYEDYYARQLSEIQRKYPLISRMSDYYKDAFFSRDDLNKLVDEIKSLLSIAVFEDSKKLLHQLLEASEAALEKNAELALIAD